MLTIREQHIELEQTPFPQSLVLAWYPTFPLLQIQDALRRTGGFGEEAERVVTAPLLPGGNS